MKLLLQRVESTSDGVFGQLHVPHLQPLWTVEEEWLDNQRRISCIPAGTYRLARTMYHRYKYPTYEVTGVEGRTRILFHPANTEEDVEGCIGLGTLRSILLVEDEDTKVRRYKQAVLHSKKAFALFMAAMDGAKEAELKIEWAQ